MSNVKNITKDSVLDWLNDHDMLPDEGRSHIGQIIHDITGNKSSPTGTDSVNRALNAIDKMIKPKREKISQVFGFELDTSTDADDVFLVAKGVDVEGTIRKVWIARGTVDEMEPMRLTFQSLLEYVRKHDVETAPAIEPLVEHLTHDDEDKGSDFPIERLPFEHT